MKDLFLKSTAAAAAVEETPNDYQEVWDELDSFVKSRAASKKKASMQPVTEPEKGPEEELHEEPKDTMGKSVTSGNGEKGDPAGGEHDPQVLNGEEVIQGFHDTLKKSFSTVRADVATVKETAMEAISILAKSTQALMREVATLREQVEALSNGGRPRKSLLKSVGAGEPAQTQGHYEGMEFGEIMNRATMVKSFSATDIGVIRQLVQTNQPIPKPAWEQIKNVKL